MPKVIQLVSVRGKLQIQVCSCQSLIVISPLFSMGLSKVGLEGTGGWEAVLGPRLKYDQHGRNKKVLFFEHSFSRYIYNYSIKNGNQAPKQIKNLLLQDNARKNQ